MADNIIRLQGTLLNGRRIQFELVPDMESLNEIDNFFKSFGYEKVVYCEDCKHSEYDGLFDEYWCDGRRVCPKHYCSIGELRHGNKQ